MLYTLRCVSVQDPVNASPAVLVKRYNISQQKHVEQQLLLHEEALQRSATASNIINNTPSMFLAVLPTASPYLPCLELALKLLLYPICRTVQ